MLYCEYTSIVTILVLQSKRTSTPALCEPYLLLLLSCVCVCVCVCVCMVVVAISVSEHSHNCVKSFTICSTFSFSCFIILLCLLVTCFLPLIVSDVHRLLSKTRHDITDLRQKNNGIYQA